MAILSENNVSEQDVQELTEQVSALSQQINDSNIEYNDDKINNGIIDFFRMANDPKINEFADQPVENEIPRRKRVKKDDAVENLEESTSNPKVAVPFNNVFTVTFSNLDVDGEQVEGVIPIYKEGDNPHLLSMRIYSYTKFDEDGKPHSLLKTLFDAMSLNNKTDINLNVYTQDGRLAHSETFLGCTIENIYHENGYTYVNDDYAILIVQFRASALTVDC